MGESSSRSLLSPRNLLGWLAPSFALDRQVVGGYRVTDCYRLSASEPVRIELRQGFERFEIEVEPSGEARPGRVPASAAGLDFGYRRPAPVDLALVACTRAAEALRARLGPGPRRWVVAAPGLAELAESIADEVRCDEVGLDSDPDAALLERDFRAYERLYGARPRARQVSVLGQPTPGLSVHYPAPAAGRVPSLASLIATSLRVAHRRRMRRHFAELGFVFDDQAILRTVPTPTTYSRALARREGLAALRPRMIAGVRASLWRVQWGALVRRNILPISVAPSHAVVLYAAASRLGLMSRIACDVGMAPHDMGVHAAAIHAMPDGAWDELLALAVERARARLSPLLTGVLARLAGFFEGPVTARCWRAWYDADEPEDFERCYAPQHRALLDELRSL
ncbi:hypothetical protein ACNOYE_13440 [Nannocystaceae bacterium ST9]